MTHNAPSYRYSPSPESGRADHARAPRTSRLIAGTIRRANGAIVGARIRNLSASGLGGKCDIALDRDEVVEVTLPGIGSVTGRIAWAHNDKFGLALDTAIDPGVLTFGASSAVAQPYVVPVRVRPIAPLKRPPIQTR